MSMRLIGTKIKPITNDEEEDGDADDDEADDGLLEVFWPSCKVRSLPIGWCR